MLLSLAACGAHRADTSSANKIRYNEKYIRADHVNKPEEQQTYYIFTADTLTYHYFYSFTSIDHYTIVFRYEIIDEGTLACFFDSVEIHDDHNSSTKESDFYYKNGLLLFSENVLINNTSSGNINFIRESYLKEELTNFGKPEN